METEVIKKNQTTKKNKNEMTIEFDAISINEGFARVAVAAFMSVLNPTLEEVSDVKTAVSEAVTNSIIHGYENKNGKIILSCVIEGDVLHISIQDAGAGIENVEKAMEPLFTSRPELERSGMGFSFMEAFMDDLEVVSKKGEGTIIIMKKKMGCTPWIREDED